MALHLGAKAQTKCEGFLWFWKYFHFWNDNSKLPNVDVSSKLAYFSYEWRQKLICRGNWSAHTIFPTDILMMYGKRRLDASREMAIDGENFKKKGARFARCPQPNTPWKVLKPFFHKLITGFPYARDGLTLRRVNTRSIKTP